MLDAPGRGVRPLRPRARNIGLAQGVAAVALLVVLGPGPVTGCGVGPARQLVAGGVELSLLVAIAAVGMLTRVPRMSAIAPALSLGAALPLLVGGMAAWTAASGPDCLSGMLDRDVVAWVVVPAAAAAVVATSAWLLVSRREVEPWYGARGVAVSAAAALTVLVVGLGFAGVLHGEDVLMTATLAVTIPWALAVAGTGWLRSSPAAALVTPALTQALWLLVH
jgi:hypothetical protein